MSDDAVTELTADYQRKFYKYITEQNLRTNIRGRIIYFEPVAADLIEFQDS